jgi:hypothetical protein
MAVSPTSSTSLKPIEGTELFYVANCATPVIKVSDTAWYSCQNGIWFVAKTAHGPWIVATNVPPAIYSIPVTSPLHYVTYVRIYTFDTDRVYLGVTPGYYGTIVSASGTVVYGTGYVYPAYVGATVFVFYPITYGYAATPCWTPWVGWHYGYASAWSWGVGYYYCPPAPYWGPYGPWSYGWAYNASGGITAWGPYGWAGTSGWIYHQNGPWTGVTRSSAGFNAWTGNEWATQYGRAYNSVTGIRVAGRRGTIENVYTGNYVSGGQAAAYNRDTGAFSAGEKMTVGNAGTGRSATVARGVVSGSSGQTVTARGAHAEGLSAVQVNDHAVAARDGNVYRRTAGGDWEQVTRPQPQPGSVPGDDVRRQSRMLNQEAMARELGRARERSFQFSRPVSQGGGGRLRGGGFRR